MTDYLSRRPLPETEQSHDKGVKAIVEENDAVTIETIEEATRQDPVIQKLKIALETGKWGHKDPDLSPYYVI